FFRQKAAAYYANGTPPLDTSFRVPLASQALVPSVPDERAATSSTAEGVPAPLPIISRKIPAYTSATSSPYGPQLATDDNYGTYWRSVAIPAWLTYDVSTVPIANRGQVVIAWYNGTGDYDHRVGGGFG